MSRCRTCHTLVAWATTPNDETISLDATFNTAGDIIPITDPNGDLVVTGIVGGIWTVQASTTTTVTERRCHTHTCPNTTHRSTQ